MFKRNGLLWSSLISPSPSSQHPIHQQVLIQLPLFISTATSLSKPPLLSSGWCSSLLTGHFASTLIPSFLSPTQAARVAIQSHKPPHVTFSPLKSFSAFPVHCRIKSRLITIPSRQDPYLRFLWPQGITSCHSPTISSSPLYLPDVPGALQDGFHVCFCLLNICTYSSKYCLHVAGSSIAFGLFLNMLSSLGLPLISSPYMLSIKMHWFISP